ncbi:S-layer homology domain-containing protein [Paenibacillus guangzhouensis]|uniref:S-layer homology domain-containing protein n=1 Tax=Paenibacillus guangzhouensis TaxID=1473112 RepID=UPI00187B7735|nr:S-layer homology domain-containing protein [Paenibacillus guangzhouensis]
MKKILSIIMAIALLVALIPIAPDRVEAAIDAHNFSFPNEQYKLDDAARIVNNERLTLNGTIHNVIGRTISYDVVQIYKKLKSGSTTEYEEVIVDSREGQTGNITLNGSSIQVFDIKLFPGLNRITFKGTQGTSSVEDSIYIEYRNAPMMYNLTATLNGNNFDVKEDSTTVVYSDATNGRTTADISITGNAPNAEKVTVTVNNKSWDYTVRSTDNWKFVASPVNIRKGKNILNIKVYNNNQVTETTREIAFYNGEVTFYDLNVTDGVNSGDLATNPNIAINPSNALKVTGKVIVPVVYTPPVPPATTGTYKPAVGNLTDAALKYSVDSAAYTDITSISTEIPGFTQDPSTKFMTLIFDAGLAGLSLDQPHTIQFSGWNFAKLPSPGTDLSGLMQFTLNDQGKSYIYDVNYLPGYTASTTVAELETMQGISMMNANMNSVPVGVEVLVGNPTGSDSVAVTKIVDNLGNTVPNTGYAAEMITGVPALYVYKTINGVEQRFQRIFLKITKLPTAGKMTLELTLNTNGSKKNIPVTLLYGPFVKYSSLFDGKIIKYDTTRTDALAFLIGELSSFSGQIFNVANTDEIRYSTTGTPAQLQSVFLYINNTLVELEGDATDKTKFKLKSGTDIEQKAFDALYKTGDNTIKFVFKTPKNTYEQTIKLTLIPTNLPVIPAPGTDGVFPYSTSYNTPKVNDPNFEKKGSVYMSKQAHMNIFGTFDFIDLGYDKNQVTAKLTSLAGGTALTNYKVKVTSPGEQDIVWTLANTFTAKQDGETFQTGSSVPGISVVYDYEQQNFSFVMLNHELPRDGSPKVYNIYVYNSGDNGPFASYRLEIQPIAIPYTIEKPKVEKRILNQNYVEVVISSPGAEKMTIQKKEAEKFMYDPDNDDTTANSFEAFRAMVYDLKPNKDNKIELVITKGKEVTKDSFTVKYVPTTIPGMQVMEQMKNSHKVFEGKLNLTFAKDTNLVRTDYNATDKFKGQVYTGNRILFAIANPDDGVIDRHDFEPVPANYNLELEYGKQVYRGNFPTRFVKASSVYWLDPGMADDISTGMAYDPIMYGNDPFPLKNQNVPFFFMRSADRELVPSKPGTLTLSYDPTMTQDAGRLITVFRFDPVLKQWENIGGVVDEKKHVIKVPFTRFGYYVVAKLGYSFNDTVLHPYARDAIETIFAKGVMNAVDPSGMFGADEYVTRAEFTRMIVRALEIPLNYEGDPKHFTDIPSSLQSVNLDGLWDFRYIETAARKGIVRGVEPQYFGADRHILRQDAAVMIAKALNLKLETDPVKVKTAVNKVFQDGGKIDYYAQPSIAAIAKKNFITGIPIDPTNPKKGFNFQPDSRLLRSDAAIIISRVMADMKKLPKIYSN